MSESYLLEFVLILFEDNGFSFETNNVHIRYYCLPVDWCKTDQTINVNQTHNLPLMLSRTHGMCKRIGIHNSGKKDHTEPGTQKPSFLATGYECPKLML